jgi:hypothetical protein
MRMDSKKTRDQIKHIDSAISLGVLGEHGLRAEWYLKYCQAKLVLVQTLEIQERMEQKDKDA